MMLVKSAMSSNTPDYDLDETVELTTAEQVRERSATPCARRSSACCTSAPRP